MDIADLVSAMRMKGWLREPLTHFLLAGGLLFVLAGRFDGAGAQPRAISVDRQDLLNFMQGRAQVYDEATFAALLDRMTPAERKALVRDVATQEALYREGAALGLAEADPLIRQRIVQQMRLLLMEEAAAGMAVSEAEARAFHARNKARYALGPRVTFSHVFVPGGAAAQGGARSLLARLTAADVPADRAGRFGERFLYQLNYVDAPRPLVESHFGAAFAAALFGRQPGGWLGPIRSDHGWHLVRLVRADRGRVPDFAEVAANVREDALAEKRQAAAGQALDRLLARYAVSTGSGVE
jgi:parvulin-like peptidyl-prolyl isomerase